jgi:hypothetical protein
MKNSPDFKTAPWFSDHEVTDIVAWIIGHFDRAAKKGALVMKPNLSDVSWGRLIPGY